MARRSEGRTFAKVMGEPLRLTAGATRGKCALPCANKMSHLISQMSQDCNSCNFNRAEVLPLLFAVLCLLGAGTSRGVAATPTFASGVSLGKVTAAEITEASGLIASRQNPGVLWTHNDSSFPGSIFAVRTNGTLLARYTIPNVFFGDFEDISFGPGPSPQFQYIYLGDIGDNDSVRSWIRVFRFAEPAVYSYQEANPGIETVVGAQEIVLRYPDGPFNAEAFMVDPITG